MNWINRLSRRFRFGIDNLMIYITATMLVVYVLQMGLRVPMSYWLQFDRALILQGQVWRLISFVFLPPASTPFFIILSLYFFYFIGNSLENTWGSSRFTFYYLCGVLCTIVGGCIVGTSTNYYLNLSLFLAFAALFPDHRVMLFFVIPVKVKILAYVDALYLLLAFLQGGAAQRVAVVCALLNFFLFFGPDFFRGIRDGIRARQRRKKFQRDMKEGRDYWQGR